MRIVLLGPQGAGKGTQAQRLSTLTGAQHIATGDMVRSEIQANTALGRAIKGYNDRGAFVPDELMVAMVQPVLQTARNWILDGSLTFGAFVAFWYLAQKFFMPVRELAAHDDVAWCDRASAPPWNTRPEVRRMMVVSAHVADVF